jgi:hypothetical protein
MLEAMFPIGWRIFSAGTRVNVNGTGKGKRMDEDAHAPARWCVGTVVIDTAP